MLINGIDLSELKHGDAVDYPRIVPGRVLSLDADFLAYIVTAPMDKEGSDLTIDDMAGMLTHFVEDMRLSAGAVKVIPHVTPSGSTKGGRVAQSVLKKYQVKRDGKQKPKNLDAARTYLVDQLGGIGHMDQEADDGMVQLAYEAQAQGTPELHVICSKDKDLMMAPGIFMDWRTRELSEWPDSFGYIRKVNMKGGLKLEGRGTKFFWAQMIMGDTADDIPGIPRKGAAYAYKQLDTVESDAECFDVIKAVYKEHFDKKELLHWQTGEPISTGQILLSQALLLWMRRNSNPYDAIEFLKEVNNA